MTVRLEPPGAYHGVRSQLSRFSNSAGKPRQGGTHKMELKSRVKVVAHPDVLRR
jgi:hypothetical protein